MGVRKLWALPTPAPNFLVEVCGQGSSCGKPLPFFQPEFVIFIPYQPLKLVDVSNTDLSYPGLEWLLLV